MSEDPPPRHVARAEREAYGRNLRMRVRRIDQDAWITGDRDVLGRLRASEDGRLPHVLPFRHGRMASSPFAFLRGGAPAYSDDELSSIAEHCTERENAARKVERTMRKIAAASLLSSRIGDTFDAIITGVTDSGTFARLLAPPAEGRIVRGDRGVDVGDRVRVKLVATEPAKGFIDFVRQ